MKARSDAARAQADAEHYKGIASEALDALDDAAAQHEQHKLFAAAAGGGVAVISLVVGGVAGVAFARRGNASQLAYLSQEMVDLRRRGAGEVARAERYGSERLAKSLVPALDAMDALCADMAPKDDGSRAELKPLWEGASMTRDVLHGALRAHGVSKVEPEIGAPFDVACMEAMLTVPVEASAADGASKVGTVQTVLRPGYVLYDGERVLRAAQVGVGAAPTA